MSARASSSPRRVPADADTHYLGYAALPVTFIATAGESWHEVEIWELQAVRPSYHTVGAYERRENRWVGVVEMRVSPVLDAVPRCSNDIKRLAKRFDVSIEKVMQVEGAFVAPTFRGEGVGVALYLAAAALARRLGMALAADSCFASTTSEDAARVWASREFRDSAAVGTTRRVAVFNPGGSRRAEQETR